MGKFIRKEAFYPFPPQKVWVAITDPRALAEWLMPNDFQPIVGHKFRFQCDPMPLCALLTECEVLEVDPPRKLVYTWTAYFKKDRPPTGKTTVTWTLTPEAGGTRLVLLHEGVQNIPFIPRNLMRFGWGTIVKRFIPKIVARVGDDGVFVPGAYPLEKRCYKVKTIPPHLTR
jgi:uncharacterized protein YndB with AHSA1/START domain